MSSGQGQAAGSGVIGVFGTGAIGGGLIGVLGRGLDPFGTGMEGIFGPSGVVLGDDGFVGFVLGDEGFGGLEDPPYGSSTESDLV